MELGFVPGHRVVFARRSPFGDPRVYQIDGAEVALRRDTALHIVLREIEGDAVLQEVEADVVVRQ
jgi:Fe2+ transport system protein FeoA